MPMLCLNGQELLALSSYSHIRPNAISPMRRLYVEQAMKQDAEGLADRVREFQEEGFLLGADPSSLQLAPGLVAVMGTLHHPQLVLTMQRLGLPDVEEAHFCRNGTMWVGNLVMRGAVQEIVLYPLTAEQVVDWFCNELMKEITFAGENMPDVVESEVLLDAMQAVTLLMMQAVYRERLKQGVRLTADALWMNRETISTMHEGISLVPGSSIASGLISSEDLKAFAQDAARMQATLARLENTGVLLQQGDVWAFGDFARSAFDPGKIQDIVMMRKVDETMSLRMLTILSNGYLIGAPVENGAFYQLRSYGPRTDKKVLFKALIQPGMKIVS